MALAGGSQRRHGWSIVAMAAAAGAFPDWDGLSIVLGGSVYGQVHRVWGHNVLAASLAGLCVGGVGYLCRLSARVRRATVKLWQPAARKDGADAGPMVEPPRVTFSAIGLTEWLLIGWLAAIIHLPADVIFSGRPGMTDWPLKLLWPFSQHGWAWPIVPWGDVATSIIFVAEMFALYRWPNRGQRLAWLTLLAVVGYVGLRWAVGNDLAAG